MQALIYFAVFAGLFFLMMRFGCGAHVVGHGHGRRGAGDENEAGDPHAPGWRKWSTEIDPVCGKTVQADTAKPSVYDGVIYYFCSQICREQFEGDPGRYTAPRTGRERNNLEEAHG